MLNSRWLRAPQFEQQAAAQECLIEGTKDGRGQQSLESLQAASTKHAPEQGRCAKMPTLLSDGSPSEESRRESDSEQSLRETFSEESLRESDSKDSLCENFSEESLREV